MKQHQYCTFSIDDSLFGIPILHVRELLRTQRMTPVPLAPKGVRGLINLRGQIVPALESRELLGLAARAAGAPSMNVVLDTAAGLVALVVDSIGDVLDLDEDALESVPQTGNREGKEFILKACKLESRLLLILDPAAITGTRPRLASPSKDHVATLEKFGAVQGEAFVFF